MSLLGLGVVETIQKGAYDARREPLWVSDQVKIASGFNALNLDVPIRRKGRFDIQLLLPELPDQHDACADRLSELIVANEGIEKAHVRNGEFCIHFDPNKISFDKVRSLVATAGVELGSRYGHLLLKTAPTYARHARTIRGIHLIEPELVGR